MKKRIVMVLLAAIMLTLSACGGQQEPVSGPEPGTPLEEFYHAVLAMYPDSSDELIFFEESDPNLIDSFYQGLSEVELAQQAFYMHPISATPCEIALAETKNVEDAQRVADIFQARINQGATDTFYPENAKGWQTNAQVYQSGCFVCMIVLPTGYAVPENVFALVPIEVGEDASPAAPEPDPEVIPVPEEEPAPEEEHAPEEEAAPLPPEAASYIAALDDYRAALSEGWTAGRYVEKGMSALAAYFGEADPLSHVGFACLDLDGDGADELLIGALDGDDFIRGQLFEVYTVENGAAISILTGSERNRYYLAEDASGIYEIINEASGSAFFSAWHDYVLDQGSLTPIQSIVYDAENHPDNPWFMGTDDDLDVSNDTVVEEELAKSIMEAASNRKIAVSELNHVPFQMYR